MAVSTQLWTDLRIHKIKGFRLRHADQGFPESGNEILFILFLPGIPSKGPVFETPA
jgi:hypothetical protein